jgi:DNA-binding NtrC family response regulator
MVRVGCLPASVLLGAGEGPHEAAAGAPPTAGRADSRISLDARLQEVETHLIGWALAASHGNKSRAAELLRIKRSTLGDRIRRLGLDPPAAEQADEVPDL